MIVTRGWRAEDRFAFAFILLEVARMWATIAWMGLSEIERDSI